MSSLLDLKSGDHIQVENTAQDPGWAKWAVSKTRDYLFDQTTNTVEPGHHMMVVRPVNNDRVRVIYLDKKGVKEEDVTLNAGNVIVLAYESPVNGDGAVENARESFDSAYDPLYSTDEHFVLNARGVSCETKAAIAPDTASESTPREVRALNELQMGDHIREESNSTCHLLVVKVIDKSRLQVIHKVPTGVVEEIKSYQPSEIKVFHYKYYYSKTIIVRRAREMPCEAYHTRKSNAEQFVIEARTGEKSVAQAKKKEEEGMWANALQES